MKLSNKGRYGICALFDIAFHNDGSATQVKEIAERQAIPPRFLEQIFQDLKRASLVQSKRGPKGGYALARPATDIRVGDIVRALEGPIILSAQDADTRTGDATSRAISHAALVELEDEMNACLDRVSLEDLCERGEANGLRRAAPRRYVYSI